MPQLERRVPYFSEAGADQKCIEYYKTCQVSSSGQILLPTRTIAMRLQPCLILERSPVLVEEDQWTEINQDKNKCDSGYDARNQVRKVFGQLRLRRHCLGTREATLSSRKAVAQRISRTCRKQQRKTCSAIYGIPPQIGPVRQDMNLTFPTIINCTHLFDRVHDKLWWLNKNKNGDLHLY